MSDVRQPEVGTVARLIYDLPLRDQAVPGTPWQLPARNLPIGCRVRSSWRNCQFWRDHFGTLKLYDAAEALHSIEGRRFGKRNCCNALSFNRIGLYSADDGVHLGEAEFSRFSNSP